MTWMLHTFQGGLYFTFDFTTTVTLYMVIVTTSRNKHVSYVLFSVMVCHLATSQNDVTVIIVRSPHFIHNQDQTRPRMT